MEKWDIFISHANEEKEPVAIPLKEALERQGLSVWLDANEMQIGDSIRRRIDELEKKIQIVMQKFPNLRKS